MRSIAFAGTGKKEALPGNKDLVFKALYEQYSRAMFNICMRMLSNREEAEDVLQESFVAAFRALDSMASQSAFPAYLKTTVINRCIDSIKKNNRHGLTLELQDVPDDGEEDAEEERDYSVEEIRQAIAMLPDGFRLILTLYLFEDYSHQMIGQKLGISEGTSKSQYARGRRRLAQLLQQQKTRR